MNNNFSELLKTFYTLEKACDTLYKFVMTEKSRLDELIKRVEVLENEKDNSR
tara:strand:- start:174 stop:329 length:156 start_codon:yes stop_codon:yes gene_type:complete